MKDSANSANDLQTVTNTGSSKKKVVMVVEDETPLLDIIRKRLEQRGFDTICTNSIEEARTYLQVGAHCDLLWVDHYLANGQSGLVLIEWVRKQEAFKGLPVFVVSNNESIAAGEAYRALGVTRQYTKVDVRLNQVIDDIQRVLDA